MLLVHPVLYIQLYKQLPFLTRLEVNHRNVETERKKFMDKLREDFCEAKILYE